MDEVVIYTSAFWSSSCCGAPFDRMCKAGFDDLYMCRKCGYLCEKVKDD